MIYDKSSENEPSFLGLESGNRLTVFLSTFFRLKFHTRFADQSHRAIGDRYLRRRASRVADLSAGDRVSALVLSQTVVFLHWPGARKTRGTMGPPVEIGHDVAVIDLVLHMYSRAPTRRRLAELWCATRPVFS